MSLSQDGTRIAIGAVRSNGGGIGINAGHVRVFEESGGVWSQMGSDIDGLASSDYFGWALKLSPNGMRLAVGAPQTFTSNGYVRVFEWSG